MRTTGIEWTEHTWNPFVGCSIHSEGCRNCYAMAQAFRIEAFGTVPHYAGVSRKSGGRRVWSGQVNRASDRAMNKPFSIRGAALIFVNSMSDFFHDKADDLWRQEALSVMRRCPQHTFQILTKRPENIGPFLVRTGESFPENVWLGVTVENADTVNRIVVLREIPAAVRFISFEPLIGSVGDLDLSGLHWAITGGESGPGARVCNPAWVRDIALWCDLYGVPLFHKQWGQYASNPLVIEQGMSARAAAMADPDGKGGSMLDGRLIKEWPHARRAVSPVAVSQRVTMASTLRGSISIA
jgi:protein gp37